MLRALGFGNDSYRYVASGEVYGGEKIVSQLNIIKAIKEVRTIKRFFPSDFGNDVDNVHAVEPRKSIFELKAKVRRVDRGRGQSLYIHLQQLFC
jgi:hypothetical protein